MIKKKTPNKLSLKKLQISKLNNPNMIRGGGNDVNDENLPPATKPTSTKSY